jgi:hypothetical protein
MTTRTTSTGHRFHPHAYQFVFEALQHAQKKLNRGLSEDPDDEGAHISGQELLQGIRELGQDQFGMLAKTVFQQWGVQKTEDFGHIVFDLIERGDMRKTDRDQLVDFCDVYDFEAALERDYAIDTSKAFRSKKRGNAN